MVLHTLGADCTGNSEICNANACNMRKRQAMAQTGRLNFLAGNEIRSKTVNLYNISGEACYIKKFIKKLKLIIWAGADPD